MNFQDTIRVNCQDTIRANCQDKFHVNCQGTIPMDYIPSNFPVTSLNNLRLYATNPAVRDNFGPTAALINFTRLSTPQFEAFFGVRYGFMFQ